MDGIELLVAEHDNIMRLNAVIKAACRGIVEGKEVCTDDFRRIIHFIREYADSHHHGKEEAILFLEMQNRLGDIGVNLVRHGMLVEHALGRLYTSDLEAALDEYDRIGEAETGAAKAAKAMTKVDIVASSAGYARLLERHIAKENRVAYNLAVKKLPQEVLRDIDKRTAEFEENSDKSVIQKHLSALEELERKYI